MAVLIVQCLQCGEITANVVQDNREHQKLVRALYEMGLRHSTHVLGRGNVNMTMYSRYTHTHIYIYMTMYTVWWAEDLGQLLPDAPSHGPSCLQTCHDCSELSPFSTDSPQGRLCPRSRARLITGAPKISGTGTGWRNEPSVCGTSLREDSCYDIYFMRMADYKCVYVQGAPGTGYRARGVNREADDGE